MNLAFMVFIDKGYTMSTTKLKWSSLLNLTELEFEPEPPKIINVSDELQQTISWLTAATGHDRRLLRCNENGALLIADAWSNLVEVETDELLADTSSSDTFTATVENKGVLIATSTVIIKATFKRLSDSADEIIYLPFGLYYWLGHPTYSVKVELVPADSGTGGYVGITAFN